MEFVRKSALVIITPLLVILLFATAADTGLVRIVTSPEKIKNILSQSGIYDTVVPALLDEAKQISNAGEAVSLSSRVTHDAAVKTFTPAFVKTNTETVIDSIYRWLEGKTPLPDFQIDLNAAKAGFAADVAAAVKNLPACPAGTTATEDFDPLVSACLPAGVDPAGAAATIEQNIVSGTGFLDHPVIAADTVKSEGDNKSLFAGQFKEVPEAYQKIKASPVILSILTILLLAAIVLLSATKRKGVGRVGISLLVVGIIILAFAYGLNRGLSEALKQVNLDNKVLEDRSKSLITEVVQEVDKTYWIFGAAYAALGGVAIAGAKFIKRGEGNTNKDGNDLEGEGKTPEDRIELKEPEEVSLLAKSAPKPAAKKSPRKINIQ